MKNILLPTDFSKNSINAIHYALKFFKNQECNFYILHVHKSSEYITDDLLASPADTSVHDSIVQKSQKKLSNLVHKLEGVFITDNFSFETIADYDSFTDSVNQIVRTKNIDLILMGSNGATGAKEKIFGSNTIKVIRKVDCPVLVIPEEFKYQPITSTLLVMDHGDHFEETKITPFTEVIMKHKANVRVLKVKEDDTITITEYNDKKNISRYFKDYEVSFHSIINIPTPIAVNSFVQIMNIDFTATFIERETFLDRFLSGSDITKISYKTTVPLLVMHY